MTTLPNVITQAGRKQLNLSVEEAEKLIADLREGIAMARRSAELPPVQLEDGYLTLQYTIEFFNELYQNEVRAGMWGRKVFDKLLTSARFRYMKLELRCMVCNEVIVHEQNRYGTCHNYVYKTRTKVSAQSIDASKGHFILSKGEGDMMWDNFHLLANHLPISVPS